MATDALRNILRHMIWNHLKMHNKLQDILICLICENDEEVVWENFALRTAFYSDFYATFFFRDLFDEYFGEWKTNLMISVLYFRWVIFLWVCIVNCNLLVNLRRIFWGKVVINILFLFFLLNIYELFSWKWVKFVNLIKWVKIGSVEAKNKYAMIIKQYTIAIYVLLTILNFKQIFALVWL